MIGGCSKEEPPPKISVQPDTVVTFAASTTAAVQQDAVSVPTVTSAPIAPAAQPVESDSNELSTHHLLIPVAGVVWTDLRDTFHEMRGTRVHNALDIMAPRGTPVLSADAGTLLKLHNSVPGGLTAYAADPTRHFIFLYGHLDSYNPNLREGQALARGDTIGYVGSTGNAAAAGPHLHFAIASNTDMKKWWMGTPLDPRPLLR